MTNWNKQLIVLAGGVIKYLRAGEEKFQGIGGNESALLLKINV